MGLIAATYLKGTRTEQEPYSVEKSSVIIQESFTVPPSSVTRSSYLTAGNFLNIHVEVTAGANKDINFEINDGTTTFIDSFVRITLDRDWTVPSSGTYNFVYDNSFSVWTSKDVTVKVTKFWAETSYRDVTISYALFPSHLRKFSTAIVFLLL